MRNTGRDGFDQGKAIEKCNYKHDAMIDYILMNPTVTQAEIAEKFGYSPGWVNRIVASDAFKAQLAKRKAELIDPRIKSAVNAKMEALVIQGAEVVARRLDADSSAELALEALGLASKVLGAEK